MKVMVAMSGGVDSSVAASMLAEEGHDVTGVTLKLWGGPADQGCCSVADVDDARRVASQLHIDHHVANMTEEFDQRVVEPYVESHRRGETPNPCIECNRHLKFGTLAEMARRLGFDALATGHHARVVRGDDGPELHRGVDDAKDQSYVLSMLEAAQLERLLLPVGALTKPEVRAWAAARGLRTSAKPESQDVCFIQASEGRRRFLEERMTLTPGALVDARSGEQVGTVDALELITVGQRKRLGVDDAGRRRVAIEVAPERREIRVGSPDESMIEHVDLLPESIGWVRAPLDDGSRVLVQLRAHGTVVPGRLDGATIRFDAPAAPVAPGQTAALYDLTCPTRVLGSALVAR